MNHDLILHIRFIFHLSLYKVNGINLNKKPSEKFNSGTVTNIISLHETHPGPHLNAEKFVIKFCCKHDFFYNLSKF